MLSVHFRINRKQNRFVCARQLKSVRRQFNEYTTMKQTLLCVTILMASYRALYFLLDDNPVLQRRVTIVCEC